MIMNVNDVDKYINDIKSFSRKNTPTEVKEFLNRLGNPQDAVPVIHVAGSNGKGSVCAMLASMLKESGKKVGLFISPHLVTITERIQINGKNCEEGAFVESFQEVKKVVDGMVEEGLPHPNFFEFLFAMGMLVFRKEKVDIAVIETGMGGRLDATNAVAKPILTIITSISLEHTEYLGDTLEKIAGEKAGIIKDGVPVVFDAKHEEVANVIFKRAEEKLAPVYPIYPGDIEHLPRENGKVVFKFDLNGHSNPVYLPFVAEYQAENGAIAMQAAEILIENDWLCEDDMYNGFEKCSWPGRMQEIEKGIFIDGAHNEDGTKQLIATINELGMRDIVLLFSMVREKNYERVIELLSSGISFSKIVVTEIEGWRKLDASVMAELFRSHVSTEVKIIESPKEAFEYAKSVRNGHVMLCTGSLYLMGMILGMEE